VYEYLVVAVLTIARQAKQAFPVESNSCHPYIIRMTKPDEVSLLKSRVKVLEQKLHGLAADLESTERRSKNEIEILKAQIKQVAARVIVRETELKELSKEFEALKLKQLRDAMTVVDNRVHLQGCVSDAEKSIARLGKATGARTRELFERLSALETHVFKKLGSLEEVNRILGAPNHQTPPELDKPKRLPKPRRRR
jgi:chromosome segregation ATPase